MTHTNMNLWNLRHNSVNKLSEEVYVECPSQCHLQAWILLNDTCKVKQWWRPPERPMEISLFNQAGGQGILPKVQHACVLTPLIRTKQQVPWGMLWDGHYHTWPSLLSFIKDLIVLMLLTGPSKHKHVDHGIFSQFELSVRKTTAQFRQRPLCSCCWQVPINTDMCDLPQFELSLRKTT